MTERSFIVGRHPDCDISLDDPSISRLHLRLEQTEDGFRLTDLGSSLGTHKRKGDVWTRVITDTVAADDPIRVGEFETSVAALLETVSVAAGPEQAGNDALTPEKTERKKRSTRTRMID